MSSFQVKWTSHVPNISVKTMLESKDGDAVLLITNDGNNMVTAHPRFINLIPHTMEVKFDQTRLMFQVPEGCTHLQVDVGIGEMHTSSTTSFLGVEITSPEFCGENSPFPVRFDVGEIN